MARLNAASEEKARRAQAIAIGFDQGAEQQSFRMRKAMLLVAIVMLGTAMASHAFAAGAHMGGGLAGGFGGGHMGGHMGHGFTPPIIDQTSPMAPTFNPSDSYTVPQSPEAPVSPASPGSVFGNG